MKYTAGYDNQFCHDSCNKDRVPPDIFHIKSHHEYAEYCAVDIGAELIYIFQQVAHFTGIQSHPHTNQSPKNSRKARGSYITLIRSMLVDSTFVNIYHTC